MSGTDRSGISRRNVLIGGALLAGSPLFASFAGAQSNTEMRISWWGSDDRHKKTLEVIKLFEAKNPGVHLTPNYGGLIGYGDKLSTEFAGGNAPDVMQISDNREALIGAGRILDLDDAINSGALNLSDANKGVLETMKVDGKTYSIPWGLACGCWFLDTKVFADAGVELPGPDWTWDQYASIARTISEKVPGIHGSADIWAPSGTRSLAPYEFFLRQRGKFAFTTDGKLGFGPEELTEWFTFWDDLRKAGAVTPAEMTALESGFETSPIVTGRAAMYPINSSIASSLQALAPNPLVIRPFPTGVGSTALPGPDYGGFVNSSMQVYVNASSVDPTMAVKFLDFVTNDPDAAKIHLMARGVPFSAKMAALVTPEISPIEQSMVETIKYVQDHAIAGFVPWGKFGTAIQDLMQRSHQAVAFEQTSVADTVKAFFDEAGQIIV